MQRRHQLTLSKKSVTEGLGDTLRTEITNEEIFPQPKEEDGYTPTENADRTRVWSGNNIYIGPYEPYDSDAAPECGYVDSNPDLEDNPGQENPGGGINPNSINLDQNTLTDYLFKVASALVGSVVSSQSAPAGEGEAGDDDSPPERGNTIPGLMRDLLNNDLYKKIIRSEVIVKEDVIPILDIMISEPISPTSQDPPEGFEEYGANPVKHYKTHDGINNTVYSNNIYPLSLKEFIIEFIATLNSDRSEEHGIDGTTGKVFLYEDDGDRYFRLSQIGYTKTEETENDAVSITRVRQAYESTVTAYLDIVKHHLDTVTPGEIRNMFNDKTARILIPRDNSLRTLLQGCRTNTGPRGPIPNTCIGRYEQTQCTLRDLERIFEDISNPAKKGEHLYRKMGFDGGADRGRSVPIQPYNLIRLYHLIAYNLGLLPTPPKEDKERIKSQGITQFGISRYVNDENPHSGRDMLWAALISMEEEEEDRYFWAQTLRLIEVYDRSANKRRERDVNLFRDYLNERFEFEPEPEE